MWLIKLDTKDFIKIKEGISKVFMTLPIEMGKDGYKIKNMSQTREAAITINFHEKDMTYEFDNKNTVTFTLPFNEFLDAVRKIKTPIEIGEEGTAKVYIKSEKVTYMLDKQQDVDDIDMRKNYDGIIKLHTKKDATKLIIGQGDFIDAVDQLSFSSGGVVMTVVNKQLTFESLKGSLAAKYVMDVDVDDAFEWTGSFNTEYMKMIKNLAYYSTNVEFFVKAPEEDKPLAVIVELAIGSNSDISIIMAGLKEEDMVEDDDEDDDTAEGKEEEFEFEEDDDFYDEEE